jgi:hypothetical protein
MRRLVPAGLVLIAVFVLVGGAGAVVNGEPDGDGHPNVGALLAPQAYSDGTWAACSGTLISPTVFLTAEHCDFGQEQMAVTFASSYDPNTSTTYTGTWYGDPQYRVAQDDPHDLAVVVFDDPVVGITPARLPAADSLSSLPKDQGFTSVGYGAQSVTIDHGPTFHYSDTRFVSTSDKLFATNKAWLRISMNPALGDGGTCYGDSGGPNFLGETNVVAATTITGDFLCRATNVVYRLDTPSAREFLKDFVALP